VKSSKCESALSLVAACPTLKKVEHAGLVFWRWITASCRPHDNLHFSDAGKEKRVYSGWLVGFSQQRIGRGRYSITKFQIFIIIISLIFITIIIRYFIILFIYQ